MKLYNLFFGIYLQNTSFDTDIMFLDNIIGLTGENTQKYTFDTITFQMYCDFVSSGSLK